MSAPPLRAITSGDRIASRIGMLYRDVLECGHQITRSQPAKRRRCYACIMPCTRCAGTGTIGESTTLDGRGIQRSWIHFRCPDCEGDGWMRIGSLVAPSDGDPHAGGV